MVIHAKSRTMETSTLPLFDSPAESTRSRVYLLPGNLHASTEPCEITTILGSCVSLCLWDKHRRIGGMNHYLLPEGPEDSGHSGRYGNLANQTLLTKLQMLGCDVRDLNGKIFGGASAFAAIPENSLGAQNVRFAEEFLRKWRIPLLLKQVNGKRGRRLTFHTDDGTAFLKVFAKP